jgi:putative oxidoreductase
MKVAALIARLLLGLVFLVFGLNGFLNFLPLPALTGLAGQFIDVLAASHFMVFVFTLEMLGGLLLLVNRFVPLALVLLGPVIVSIFLFHALLDRAELGLAVLVMVLWVIVAAYNREHLVGIFRHRTG